VRKAHEDLLEQGAAPVGVRDVVADSWLRSVAAGVNVDASRPPITLDRDLLSEYRAEHPLAAVFPLLYDVLGRAAEDCDSVMAVTDARGQLLWVRGKPGVLRRAESIQFVEGAQWDEHHAGTNAPGTALRLDAPVAPGVTELRADLERPLRAAILASGEPEFMLGWTRTRWGADDLPMWQRLRAVLPAGSPLRPIAAATAARLDAEFRG
jgi:hypothetical protein